MCKTGNQHTFSLHSRYADHVVFDVTQYTHSEAVQ